MAKKKAKLSRTVYLKREEPTNDEPYWATYDSEEEALNAAEDGDTIYVAKLEPIGTVRKQLER